MMSLTTSWWDMVETSEPFTWEGEEERMVPKAQRNASGSAFAGAFVSHLYDSVALLDAGLDRSAARSDILDQLDPLPADGEAEAQVVLLHHHTSLDETGAWEKDKRRRLARQRR